MATAHPQPRAGRLRPALAAFGTRVQRVVAAAVSRPTTWILFVGTLWAIPLGRSLTRDLPAPPAMLGQLPAFELTTENGETLTPMSARGRMWIVQFATLDAVQDDTAWVAAHLRLQHRLRFMSDSARILTVTVDPEHDTRERLAAFSLMHRVNPAQWTMATGRTADLHAALSDELRQQRAEVPADATLATTGYFVLIDPDLRVRGYYPPDQAGMDALIADCGLIANLYEPAETPAEIAS